MNSLLNSSLILAFNRFDLGDDTRQFYFSIQPIEERAEAARA
jgi:hypothetical protein